jgi:hypothetical protein
MTLGMSLSTFTTFHVAISLIGIGSGIVFLFGLIAGRLYPLLTGLFLLTTIATSVTGFLFPFHGITPGIVVGILSLIVLALALLALYGRGLAGGWRTAFVISSCIALYFNVFVLIVQSFQKVPALHVLAPTQSEAPFKIAQLINLILFLVLTALAVRRFRGSPGRRDAAPALSRSGRVTSVFP